MTYMLSFEGDQKEERRLKPFFFMNFLHSMVEEMKTQRLCVYEHENKSYANVMENCACVYNW